jgi:hypothetical protein
VSPGMVLKASEVSLASGDLIPATAWSPALGPGDDVVSTDLLHSESLQASIPCAVHWLLCYVVPRQLQDGLPVALRFQNACWKWV